MTRNSVNIVRERGERFIFWIIFCLLSTIPALAQNSTSSPYSIYGVGIIEPKEDTNAAGMGHTGIALAPHDWVNVANPAGICQLDSLAFYFNVQVKTFYSYQKSGREHQYVYSTNIDGITAGFRCTRWMCMALGYNPYSTVGYNMNLDRYIIGTNDKYDAQFSGNGGLSQAYIMMAFTAFHHLTLAGDISMLWGKITNLETAVFSGTIAGEDIYNEKKYTMNNLFYEFGLQYDFNIGKNNFRLGGIFNMKTHLLSSYDHWVYNDIDSELFFDDVTPLNSDFYVPLAFGFGLTYLRNWLTFSVDYKQSNWSDVPISKFRETAKYRDSFVLCAGLQVAPGKFGDPFYKRIVYRLGYSYTKDYLNLRGVNLNNFKITAGLNIPLGRWTNAIALAYEFMQRGTTYNGMVEEKHHSIKIGINIMERWFIKSKFD